MSDARVCPPRFDGCCTAWLCEFHQGWDAAMGYVRGLEDRLDAVDRVVSHGGRCHCVDCLIARCSAIPVSPLEDT